MRTNLKIFFTLIISLIIFVLFSSGSAIAADVKYAQKGSILIRNGAFSSSYVGHAGVFLDKDAIAQANGVGSLSSSRTYSGFLGGNNTYLGHFRNNLADYQESVFRDWIEYYALKAIGKSYTAIHLYAYPALDFSRSDGVPYSTISQSDIPTDFRCDGLAEWSVEQARATYDGRSPFESDGFYVNNYSTHDPDQIANTYGITDTPPDLAVLSVDAPNGTHLAGSSISVSNSIDNTGGGPTTYSVKFYASTNTIISTTDILLTQYSRSIIEYDVTDVYNSTMNLPTLPGTYYIGVIAEYVLNGVTYSRNGYDNVAVTVTAPVGTPSNITVPSSDPDGGYTVSWGASATSSVTYVLEEATNSGFTAGLRTAYSGTALSAAISGRSNGTYYYRVKATRTGYTDSGWRTGSNGCVVTLPLPVAGTPSSIIVPASDPDGGYTVSWGASATASVTYFLEEATNSGFTTGLRSAYSGTALSAAISGRSNGTYYYRVKATRTGYTDSGWRTGSNGCVVTLPLPVAGTPSSISVPASDPDGGYTVSWGSSSTTSVTYVLEEATNAGFTSGLRTAYSGTALSAAISGRGNGTYYYRVKATRTGYTDSGWRTGSNGCVVTSTLPVVGTPASISVPASDPDGGYTVSWGSSSTASVTYVLEEATNSGFTTGLRTAYSGTGLSAAISGRSIGTYYYRVKATRSVYADSGWRTGSNGCSVSTPSGLTLGDALDNTSLSWTTSGNANWTGQTTTSQDGVDAGQSGTITDSQSSSFETTVTGPGALSFYWQVSSESGWDYLRFYIDGVEQTGSISGTVAWAQKTYNLASGTHTLKWSYSKDSSYSAGSDRGWVDQVVWTPSASSLGTALDNTALTWTTSGDANWTSQTTTSYDGVDAGQSGTITDSQSTSFETTVTGPGALSFYWQVSSESGWDYLRFYIDGVEQSGSISGTVAWAQKTYNLASGTHTLKWSYSKDSSYSAGSDRGWVDQVVWTPGAVLVADTPISISVPASDPDGGYTVSWGASATASVTYVLEEATNAGFTAGLRTAYSGTTLSASITGRTSGTTYYYRVKATRSGYTDSDWRTGTNGCAVSLPVGIPASITIPTSDPDGEYTVIWGASSTVSVSYVLEEATNTGFTAGLRTVYSGTALSAAITGRSTGATYYYRVKATRSGYTDSGWRMGTNGCAVSLSVGTPASIRIPTSDPDGGYTVSWGPSATTNVTYALEEATNSGFTAGLRISYIGTALSASITGRTSGTTYYYRIKATRSGYTESGWLTGSNGCVVMLSAGTPPSLTTSTNTSTSGSYIVSWGASSTASVTYVLEEATNSAFTAGLHTVYTGTALTTPIIGRMDGSYYYRVKATRTGYTDSLYFSQITPVTVTLPLGISQSGYSRLDGGDPLSNLVGSLPKVDLEYNFKVTVKESNADTVWLVLDGYRHQMTMTGGDVTNGAVFTYLTRLGPAPKPALNAAHSYYYEVLDAMGTVLDSTLPTDGPTVELLNGMNMVGLARDMSGSGLDVPQLLGSNPVYSWVSSGVTTDRINGDWQLLDSFATPNLGEGYFATRELNPTLAAETLNYPETASQTASYELQPGWNLISNPYGGVIQLSDVEIRKDSDTPVSWTTACSNRWLINAIYYYDGDDWGGTYSFESAGGSTEAVLTPWLGYWIYVVRNDATYTLIFSKPQE